MLDQQPIIEILLKSVQLLIVIMRLFISGEVHTHKASIDIFKKLMI